VKKSVFRLSLWFLLAAHSAQAGGFAERLSGPKPDDAEMSGRGKAFFLSLLVPGAGEYYAGSKKWATVFAVSELTLWTTFTAFRMYGNMKRDDARLFAAAHAGIDLSGKDDRYFVNIENFMSLGDYNAFKLKQRDLNALYPEDETHAWQWDSETSRRRYERMRVASDRAYSRSTIVVAAVILNHLVSGVDAIRVMNQRESLSEKNLQVGFVPLHGPGMALAVRKSF